MDFNTDDPVDFEEDEEDVDVALASWSKHASSSMVSSRVLSSFVEKRVIFFIPRPLNFRVCVLTIYFFLFKNPRALLSRRQKLRTHTHTLSRRSFSSRSFCDLKRVHKPKGSAFEVRDYNAESGPAFFFPHEPFGVVKKLLKP